MNQLLGRNAAISDARLDKFFWRVLINSLIFDVMVNDLNIIVIVYITMSFICFDKGR